MRSYGCALAVLAIPARLLSKSGRRRKLSVPGTSALIESPNLQRPLPLRSRSDAATNINTGANYFVNPVQLGPGNEF